MNGIGLKIFLLKIDKKKLISLDTRKSDIMKKGIENKINLINDVSGLNFDYNTIKILKRSKFHLLFIIRKVILIMQKNPKYKNDLLDIYDFFEEKIKLLRSKGIKHNNIILDPGIGFGKNLKHNMTLIKNISIYHSLGFPILLGTSRKNLLKSCQEIMIVCQD